MKLYLREAKYDCKIVQKEHPKTSFKEIYLLK